MKRTYELMVIVKSDFPVEDTKKRDELLNKLVKGATFKEITVFGKKELAYPIKKQAEGIYIVATLEGSSIKTGDLQTESKLGTDIIRFQLIQKEG
jgi:small subunit ribosomal protein S6